MLTEAAVVEAVEEAGGPLRGGAGAADGDAGHRRRRGRGRLARLGRIHVVSSSCWLLRSLRSHDSASDLSTPRFLGSSTSCCSSVWLSAVAFGLFACSFVAGNERAGVLLYILRTSCCRIVPASGRLVQSQSASRLGAPAPPTVPAVSLTGRSQLIILF